MLDLPTNRIIIAFAVFIGLTAVLRHAMTRRPAIESDPEGETGRIAPNRALLAVICLIGVALAGAALAAFLRGVGGLPVLAVALAALVMTAMMVTAFFPFYDITWDEDGIEGPTLLLPPPLGPHRRKIFWEDIDLARHEKRAALVCRGCQGHPHCLEFHLLRAPGAAQTDRRGMSLALRRQTPRRGARRRPRGDSPGQTTLPPA